ncbi:MAG: single-stranded-DNA-specific exonuclease RecJ [Patescibacteria group bacterium]
MKSYRVRERQHDDLVDDLLLARGIMPEAKEHFLNPDYIADGHDPMLLPDMPAAVERILSAQKNNEKVAVWSDYDCDGIPGGVLLTEFLRAMGLAVTHYIPHRHKEGYGLNNEGIDELVEQKVSLMITVDLGTTDIECVAYAKAKGVDTIVTDHHLVHGALPDALVINPKRPDSKYPFDGLCGAGVAWKLAQALQNKTHTLGEGQEKWLLDLAGLGTLSDMVPLVGENRMLARFGLTVMRRARRPGLRALLEVLRIKPSTLTEDDVAFMVSPRINAASRMDNPHVAAALLGATDGARAVELARELNTINDARKTLVATTVKEANKRLALGTPSPLIVMGSPAWRPGILGLVANSLMEAHGKPVFLWGREGGTAIRGSVRSNGVSVVELMGAAKDAFEEFGGHTASGGFSLAEEKVHELPARLQSAYETLAAQGVVSEEKIVDRELSLAEVPAAYKDLQQLAPFGVGNTKPLFIFGQTTIKSMKTFGKQQNHLDFYLEQNGAHTGAIAFFSNSESFTKKAAGGVRADIVGHVEMDWRGKPRIRVVDII